MLHEFYQDHSLYMKTVVNLEVLNPVFNTVAAIAMYVYYDYLIKLFKMALVL